MQARLSSTRLPGKVMKRICDKPVIQHIWERLKLSQTIDQIVVATTTNPKDEEIVELCCHESLPFYRGSEEDTLSRYYEAATTFGGQIIVRVTSDCPLIDPFILDAMIQLYKTSPYACVSNAGLNQSHRTFPRGLDAEIFGYNVLKEAQEKSDQPYQREHVTPYIYEHFPSIYYYKNDIDYSHYRWTLDTNEDLALMEAIYEDLYHGKPDFFLKEILALFKKKPWLQEINKDVIQKQIKQ